MGSREPSHGCADCEVDSLLKEAIFRGLSCSKMRNAQIFQGHRNAIIIRYTNNKKYKQHISYRALHSCVYAKPIILPTNCSRSVFKTAVYMGDWACVFVCEIQKLRCCKLRLNTEMRRRISEYAGDESAYNQSHFCSSIEKKLVWFEFQN
jgi:hypothetical protein